MCLFSLYIYIFSELITDDSYLNHWIVFYLLYLLSKSLMNCRIDSFLVHKRYINVSFCRFMHRNIWTCIVLQKVPILEIVANFIFICEKILILDNIDI